MEPINQQNINTNPTLTPKVSALENDPYASVFFEVDALMSRAKARCVERLRPLVILKPSENQIFACIEMY